VSTVQRVACDYLDGVTSARRSVTLRVEDAHAIVEGEGVLRREPLGRVRVSERMGSAPRLVSFPDGALCEVRDHDALDALLGATGFRESVVARAQSRWPFVAGAAAVCVGLVAAAYFFLLPWGARIAADHIPQSVVESLSRVARNTLDRHQVLAPSGIPGPRRVASASRFSRMVPPDGVQVPHAIAFRASPRIGANAFALPSGTIVVTDQLVDLAASDDEILAVLTHELGHVHHRHGLRKALQSSVVGLVVTWYLGDVSSLVAAIPAALLDARYSRDLEREADAYARQMLEFNSLPPALLARMLDRLEAAHGGRKAGYLDSHPATDERVKALGTGR